MCTGTYCSWLRSIHPFKYVQISERKHGILRQCVHITQYVATGKLCTIHMHWAAHTQCLPRWWQWQTPHLTVSTFIPATVNIYLTINTFIKCWNCGNRIAHVDSSSVLFITFFLYDNNSYILSNLFLPTYYFGLNNLFTIHYFCLTEV